MLDYVLLCALYAEATIKRYTLFLPIPMIKRLRERSKRSGYSIAELMRQALQAFLDAEA